MMMEWMEPLARSFGGLVLVKTTLLLVLVSLLSLVLRKASASAQHYLWTLSFGALLTLPAISYTASVSPEWRLSIPVLAPAVSGLERQALIEPEPEPGTASTTARRPTPNRERVDAVAPVSAPSIARPPWWSLVWALGSAFLLVRLLTGVAASRRAIRSARQVRNEDWLDALDDAKERIGVRGHVSLLEGDASPLPMTIGVLQPAVLLPDSSNEYADERRRAVLLHELAHIRRRDCLTQLVCHAACAMFWWHPLAWFGAHKMRALSERASDDLVLDAGAEPSDYAHDLLEMARGLNLGGRTAPIASVTMAHRARLEERLLAILDPATARRTLTSRIAWPATFVAGAVLASIALAVPTVATSIGVAPTAQATKPVEAADAESPERPVTSAPQEERTETSEAGDEARDRTRGRARDALAKALDDPEAAVREQALGALIRMRDERTIPFLITALTSDDEELRARAAWGLGSMRREEATSSLIDALSDDSDDVREQAAWSLGMVRSEDAVDGLGRTVTGDASPGVREQAAWALGMIRSDAGVDALVGAVSDEDEDVRAQSVWALGMIRDARAVSGLGKALSDASDDVREQAIWALGMIRSHDSLDLLIGALRDTSSEVRSQAAWALGMLRDARAVDALTQAMADDEADVREQAAWAIGLIANGGDDDIDLDPDPDVDLDLELDLEPSGDPDLEPEPAPRPRPEPRDALL